MEPLIAKGAEVNPKKPDGISLWTLSLVDDEIHAIPVRHGAKRS